MGKLTEKDLKDICNLYVTKDVTMSEIARKYGCSSSTISSSIHKAIAQRIS